MSSRTSRIHVSVRALAPKVVHLLLAVLGLLLFSGPLFSQANFGRILGTVTDQSGGAMANATVTVTDTQRGVSRTLTTDEAGEYNAPTLLPGSYTVRAEAKGFKTLARENVVLEVGKEIRVDLSLQPGEQTQTVTVTESLPLVETTNATLGGTLNNADINDMPLNGRNYQNLMTLRPGVMTQPGGGPWTQSTNNIRPDESVWMLDGVINVNFYDARPIAGMPSPFTDGATILPIDAIQEFNLEENPKAEYGWKPGAVVNVGVKSGTNILHGSAYAFGRDVSWDARNLYNPAPNAILPTQLEQFGGVVGGPIKKDKLFFFAGYEGLRSTIGNAIGTSVPEIAAQPKADPKDSLVDALNAVKAATLPISAASMKLVGCSPSGATFACTGGLIQGASPTTTSYISSFPNTNVSDNGVAKLDYHINSKHSLNGMLMVGNYTGDGEDHPFVNKAFEDTNLLRTWSTVVNWIWTPNSRWVNEARFGYDRTSFNFVSDDSNVLADGSGLTGGSGYPINTGVTGAGGLPNINITGFNSIGTFHNRPNHWGPNPYFDFQDNISYLLGKHSFRFGAEFAHLEVESASGDTARGRIDFQGGQTTGLADCGGTSCPLEDFFAGNPSRGFLLVGSPLRTMTWTSSSGFVQDDWRFTSKVIINLGLRYSYTSPIKEDNGLFGNFGPTAGLVQQGKQGGNTLWKPDYKNFSPRLGFAWDVTGKGTTVVRAGASIIYSTLTAATFLAQGGLQNTTATSLSAVPTGANLVVNGVTTPGSGTIQLASNGIPASSLNWNGVVFPASTSLNCGDGKKLAGGAKDPSPCNIMAVDPNLRIPYVTNWNLSVQHVFTSNLALEVGYVGNHGSRLTGFRDINQINPTTGVRPFAANFPYLKFINQISNDSHSNYDSLQMTLTKRLSHGLSFTAGYTYGHGLDNGSLNRQGFLPQDSTNPGLEYGNSDFDVRNRFTFTTSYDIPGKKGFGQLLEGWKVNSIITVQGGQPWLVNDTANDFAGSGDSSDRWDFFGNPADFKSGADSFIYCTGPNAGGDTKGGCDQTSGVTGALFCAGTVGACSASQAAAFWAKCTAVAPDPGTLGTGGCFVSGNSVMVPPKAGTFGTMGRNIFPASGFENVDFSVFKNFTFRERFGAQFRVELFNLFNHPNIANPFGSINGFGFGNDPGNSPTTFGCGCSTPDVAGGNPLVGSGSARVMQLGLKLTF